jgi:hypothetical protein
LPSRFERGKGKSKVWVCVQEIEYIQQNKFFERLGKKETA